MTGLTGEQLLNLLKAVPSMLPPVPEAALADGTHSHRRTADEVHSCFRCDTRSVQALVASTEEGPRWLDLCMDCSSWLRRAIREQENRP